MIFETMHNFEIGLMEYLHAFRSPMLDQIMLLLNNLDTAPFYMLVTLIAWFLYNQKCGIRLIFLMVISDFINQNLKELLEQPRPFVLEPLLGLITSNSYGFPSGAAQSTIAVFGFLAYTVKQKWFFIASLLFVLLIAFSRVYLGMHFPSDVLGGWLIGATITIAYIQLLPSAERFIARQSNGKLLLLSTAAALLLGMLALNDTVLKRIVSCYGLSLGLLWGTLLRQENFTQKFGHFMIAVLGVFFFQVLSYFVYPNVFLSLACQFMSGFWVSCVVSIIVRKIDKQQVTS